MFTARQRTSKKSTEKEVVNSKTTHKLMLNGVNIRFFLSLSLFILRLLSSSRTVRRRSIVSSLLGLVLLLLLL